MTTILPPIHIVVTPFGGSSIVANSAPIKTVASIGQGQVINVPDTALTAIDGGGF